MFNSLLALAVLTLSGPDLMASTYEIGPGLSYTNLASMAWSALLPGDTVNIHYQPGGYHEVILLCNSGVSNAPITINGVPDPVTGALPVLDGHNAVTATNVPWGDGSQNTLGVIVVAPSASQPYGYIPSWIVIQNLQVQDADPTNSVTESSGIQAAYDITAAAIYVKFAQHIMVNGCQLNDSANGFYCGTEANDLNQLSADITIQSCWIHHNGFPGNYEGDNLTTESRGIRIEDCLIGPLRAAASGNQITDRSSGTVLAYNQFILGPNTGGAFWFSQTENGLGIIDADPAYRTNFVYGNVFYNPTNSASEELFLYDAPYIQNSPRNGTLFFYDNTVVNQCTAAERFNTSLFTLPSETEAQQWSLSDTVDCRNNIFVTVAPNGLNGAGEMTLLDSDAGTINLGTNWLSPGFQYYQLPYGSNTFFGTINGTNQLLVGDKTGLNNPGFESVAATNFQLLSSSPCIDAAGVQAPAVLASPYNPVYQYVFPTSLQLRQENGRGPDLGAFEGVATNFTGAVFTLTVSNGFGGGMYPPGALVPLAASNAPPGEAFASWTNSPVQDPGSPGTSLIMPASNLTVTAIFTNLPLPTNYLLTVVGGSGGGDYSPGATVTITANPAPTGESFVGWTGFAVTDNSAATTTVVMPAAPLTVIANFQISATFNLNVVNGTGGGSYAPGTVVNISAGVPPAGDVFSGWSGYTTADSFAADTTVTMPAQDVTVTARFVPSNAVVTTIPFPNPSHPRLWMTTNDLPRLQAWATPTNPIYAAALTMLNRSMDNYDTQYFPGGVQNPTWPDLGDSQGYVGLITEEDAFVLAFFSLIYPDPALRPVYAQRAANLIRVAMQKAALGTLAGAPFRDPLFATYNRANLTLETMPLAVDWVYDAVDTNGQPVFSAADKLTIRNGFLTWAEQCRNAETAGGDSPVPGFLNNPAALLPNNGAYRMAANNYYLGHARMLTLMSLAIDPQDDPPLNPNLSVAATTNSLRYYLLDANGAWLYQEYAMFGDGPQVAQDYGLPGGGTNLGLTSGGMPAEGMLYGHSLAFLFSQLLALQTAGFGNTNDAGPQAKLITAPAWNRFCDSWLSMLMPNPIQADSYSQPAYEFFGYGDLLRLYMTPDFTAMYAELALLDRETGNSNRVAKTSWLAVQAPQGGYDGLADRVSTSWGDDQDNQVGILLFMMLDPATQAPPPDPRPSLPTLFYDQRQGSMAAQSDWTDNRSMVHWRCSWVSINHQNADAGMFQFFRKGAFLTKEYSGYDANGNGQASLYHNTLALQNYCAAGTPGDLQWFETGLWATGSQWQLGESAGDPQTLASAGTNYAFAYGNIAPLYNRPSSYSLQNSAVDIQQANRSLLWLKPDHLVVYDRATSLHPNLFKRFNLCLPAAPSVTALPGSGSILDEPVAGGEHLFITSLLPASGTVEVYSLSNAITTVADGEPCNYRLTIEDTNNPADIRFLHVLQGTDAGGTSDPATYVQSSSGNQFDGVVVFGSEILFPVTVLSNNFTNVSYAAPVGVTNHYLAGLTPNARYSVNLKTNAGSVQVAVTPGTQLTADSAGLLVFDRAGNSLQSSASQWTSILQANGNVQLTGVGTQLQSYQVQAANGLTPTNWATIGSATADGGGNLQYTDGTPTNSPARFYRLSH